ncbi:MAG: ribosome biogenesis GTPase Der, partial [Bifidobacteriaceae bacterium]|nr:ribosome biogenesis GTPase Der [Bifidobacteriaceae bacterium]
LDFEIVDTGGWDKSSAGLGLSISKQSEIAIQDCDLVVFILSADVGITATDEQLVKIIRRSKKDTLLVVNKVDSEKDSELAEFYTLGLGDPFGVSALHGRGIGEFLDAVVEKLKAEYDETQNSEKYENVALIGKPNSGKSSLLNALLNDNRVTVDSVAGTTRDAIDETVKIGDKLYNFIDTAGIKRRQWALDSIDYYASLRTQTAIDRADAVIMLIDANEGITDQEQKILSEIIESGKALVIAFNKWDLLNPEKKDTLEIDIDEKLGFAVWARRINISAKTAWHINRIENALVEALASYKYRVPTSKVNAFIKQLTDEHPHPVRGGKQPRILYGSQVAISPPKFVFHTNGFLEAPYRRFIENRLREAFPFTGTPIFLSVKVKEKRKR